MGNREVDKNEIRSSADFPAYNIYANDKWNYAVKKETPVYFQAGSGTEFDLCYDLPSIEIFGYEALDWNLEHKEEISACKDLYKKRYITKKGDFIFTPSPEIPTRFSDKPVKLKLYPYGASKLRITVFPKIKR